MPAAVVYADDLLAWAPRLGAVALLLLMLPVAIATLGFGAILALFGGLSGTASGGGSVAQSPPDQGVLMESVAAAGLCRVQCGGLIGGWANRPALNQYSRSNYRSDQSWLTWRNVDCSAAALDWLLGAYGQQFGSLDDAIEAGWARHRHIHQPGPARCSREPTRQGRRS